MKTRLVHVERHQESWDGVFHGWIHLSEHPDGTMLAVVETESGNVRYVPPLFIKFLDGQASADMAHLKLQRSGMMSGVTNKVEVEV